MYQHPGRVKLHERRWAVSDLQSGESLQEEGSISAKVGRRDSRRVRKFFQQLIGPPMGHMYRCDQV